MVSIHRDTRIVDGCPHMNLGDRYHPRTSTNINQSAVAALVLLKYQATFSFFLSFFNPPADW